ncbi:MAG: CPBP family intramembrane metalloprotease [Clostridia bacterium]|nr:CPBP family intramembrane metalloprotease [Clostridia bacterium]
MDARCHFSRLGWALFGVAGAANISQLFITWIMGEFYPQIASSRWFPMMLIAVGYYVFGLPVMWYMTRFLDGVKIRPVKRAAGGIISTYLVCMAIGYLCSWLGTALSGLVSAVTGTTTGNPVAELVSYSGILPTAVVSGIMAPVVEELIFRGILLSKARIFGDRPAVILSAVTFGLMHMNLYQFFYAFVIGIILGKEALEGGIGRSILLHMMINLTGAVIMPLLIRADASGMLASQVIMLIMAAGIFLWIRQGRGALKLSHLSGSGEAGASDIYINLGVMAYIVSCLSGFVVSVI